MIISPFQGSNQIYMSFFQALPLAIAFRAFSVKDTRSVTVGLFPGSHPAKIHQTILSPKTIFAAGFCRDERDMSAAVGSH